MHFADLNWMDVERYLEQDDRVIVITGACEQHGYISLMTDIEIPKKLATAVAQRTHVLIAPSINIGISPYFMEYPGTLTLRPETFSAVVIDVVSILYHHGFRRVLILNGHGGNQKPPALDQYEDENPSLSIYWHNWWNSPVAQSFASELGLNLGHANWAENFPFCRVAEVPSGRKPLITSPLQEIEDVRAQLGDGTTGDYYQINDEQMQRFFAFAVDEITQIVESM